MKNKTHFNKICIWMMLLAILISAGCSSEKEEGISVKTTVYEKEDSAAKETGIQKPRILNDIVMSEKIGLKKFPEEVSLEFDERSRYRVVFDADAPVQVVVYSEQRYLEWKKTRVHTLSKHSTKSGDVCCQQRGELVFDINKGEGGTYYVVFDDSLLPGDEMKPTNANLKIVKEAII